MQTLLKLRQFQCKILVATDLAARGIDAEHIDFVIHIDVPRDAATYLHRVGRAGRFGAAAVTCTIACEGNELTELRSIITKSRASVRILAKDHLALHDQDQPPVKLTIQALDSLWHTLPELEGTGLVGEGVTDSLLSNIENDFEPDLLDATRALLPQGKKKRQNKSRGKPEHSKREERFNEEVEIEQGVKQLSITEEEEPTAPIQQHNWLEWYQSWMHYMKWNKAMVEQQAYLRLMSNGLE